MTGLMSALALDIVIDGNAFGYIGASGTKLAVVSAMQSAEKSVTRVEDSTGQEVTTRELREGAACSRVACPRSGQCRHQDFVRCQCEPGCLLQVEADSDSRGRVCTSQRHCVFTGD